MAPPPTVFHALLRPAVLQILRAAGYSHTRAPVLDSLTDLAVRYFFRLCQVTAACAAQSGASEDGTPDLADVRLALQFVGALLPEKLQQEQEFFGVEDTRGTDEFVAWAEGAVNREIRRVALDGNEEAMDWLDGGFSAVLRPCLCPHAFSIQGELTSWRSAQKEAQQDRRRHQVHGHLTRQAGRTWGRHGGGRRVPDHRHVGGEVEGGGAKEPRSCGRKA